MGGGAQLSEALRTKPPSQPRFPPPVYERRLTRPNSSPRFSRLGSHIQSHTHWTTLDHTQQLAASHIQAMAAMLPIPGPAGNWGLPPPFCLLLTSALPPLRYSVRPECYPPLELYALPLPPLRLPLHDHVALLLLVQLHDTMQSSAVAQGSAVP